MIILAANILASKGLYVLFGVASKDMRHYMSQSAIKGVEMIEADINEPASIGNILYRSREITRDLNRPLVGVTLLYPGQEILIYS